MKECLAESVVRMRQVVLPGVGHEQTVLADQHQVGAQLQLAHTLQQLIACPGGDVLGGEVGLGQLQHLLVGHVREEGSVLVQA